MEPKETYGIWETQAFNVPSRSRLYSFAPVGIGTPHVESLSGYITRLAEAHVLSIGDMVGRESMVRGNAKFCSRLPLHRARRPKRQLFHATAYDINGVSPRARRWVQVFERLTRWPNLDALTLLPLRHILSNMFLLKRRRAWCPKCYEADREAGTVYERLVWTIRGVTVCPIHAAPLEERCPFCYKALPPLAAHSRPGYRPSCGRWKTGETITATRESRGQRL